MSTTTEECDFENEQNVQSSKTSTVESLANVKQNKEKEVTNLKLGAKTIIKDNNSVVAIILYVLDTHAHLDAFNDRQGITAQPDTAYTVC